MGVTGYTEIMGETGMEILTNNERISNLIRIQFKNLYETWDNSFIFLEHFNGITIVLDGNYKNPNFDVNREPTSDDLESYRKRVNKLIESLLLNPDAAALKKSKCDLKFNLRIIVGRGDEIIDLSELLIGEENYNLDILELPYLTLYSTPGKITFRDMSYETIDHLTAMVKLHSSTTIVYPSTVTYDMEERIQEETRNLMEKLLETYHDQRRTKKLFNPE